MDTVLTKLADQEAKKTYRGCFQNLIRLEQAYGAMLTKQQLLERDDYRKILNGLSQTAETLRESDIDGSRGDLYYNVTSRLYEIVGEETGRLLHMGRSRNDIYAVCHRMELRQSLWLLSESVLSLMCVLLEKAEQSAEIIIPYFTYGQPAQPGTWAHYLMALFELLVRDMQRLQHAYVHVNRSPMGAAAGIGSCFPLDPEYFAVLLGFDGVIQNTLDAISGSDFVLETEAAIAILMTDINKAAQDLFSWASCEHQILYCDDSIIEGSSIMPQKRNPVAIECAKAKSAQAMGLFQTSLLLGRGTSLFPSYENNVELFQVYWEYFSDAVQATDLLRTVLEHSQIQVERACQYARSSFTGAASMAENLSCRFRIPFTVAHEISSVLIKRYVKAQTLSEEISLDVLLKTCSEELCGRPIFMDQAEIIQLLEPVFCLESKVTGGTPKKTDTQQLIQRNRDVYAEFSEWLNAARMKVDLAYGRLGTI